MNRLPFPLTQRKRHIVFAAFFLINSLFVTHIIDIEQNIIADPSHFTYPITHWVIRTSA